MRQFAAMLADEISSWLHVSEKPMFGVRGFYRGRQIFAALPGKRAIYSANAILLRFSNPPERLRKRISAEERMHAEQMGRRWFPFELSSADDIRDALTWLGEAYESATPRSSKNKQIKK